MLLYALKRLLYVTPVAFGVSIVCFAPDTPAPSATRCFRRPVTHD